jgi:hypothetical protein
MKTKTFVVETATGQKVADDIVDKRGYAQRWRFSPRHIDNLIAQGLPHLKIGSRRVRIHVPEADAWMHEKFGTQRRRPNLLTKTSTHPSKIALSPANPHLRTEKETV